MDKGRVLVIDDNTDICRMVGSLLQEVGYVVDQAHDGQDGLASIEANTPDLILLDMVLPRMNGWAFLRHLASRPSQPPVIVISARYCEPEPLGALEQYVWAYVRKPFNASFLIQSCDRVLRSAAAARSIESNRRNAPRRNVLIATTLLSQSGSPVSEGEVTDISQSGAQIAMRTPVADGQILRLRFDLGDSARPIHVRARVVWVKEHAFGVTFVGLTPIQGDQITAILHRELQTS
jgi:DNA-binding response OmpR family regulator